jgi:hypothetical protein
MESKQDLAGRKWKRKEREGIVVHRGLEIEVAREQPEHSQMKLSVKKTFRQ